MHQYMIEMAIVIKLVVRAVFLLSFLPLIWSLPAEASLEPRQGGYSTGIWIFTFYGWPDSYSDNLDCYSAVSRNPPVGSRDVAYPGCVHLGNARGANAGGSGTWENPLTAAAYPGSTPIPICGVFFSPYLKKFLIYEDDCPSCKGSTPHFDVWIGGSVRDRNLPGVCACEDTLTPADLKACSFWHFSGSAVNDLNGEVNTGDLWNGGGGYCNNGILDYSWSANNPQLKNICGPA